MRKQYAAPAMTEVLSPEETAALDSVMVEEPTEEFVAVWNEFCAAWDAGWKPFDGDYEKCFYDIRLRDGREWKDCWPNAGMFASTITGAQVKYAYVSSVKKLRTEDVQKRAEGRLRLQIFDADGETGSG